MKLCSECGKTAWPYVLVAFIGGLCGFVTWLTLGYSNVAYPQRLVWSLLVFAGVSALLTGYVVACMRRHCRHSHRHS